MLSRGRDVITQADCSTGTEQWNTPKNKYWQNLVINCDSVTDKYSSVAVLIYKLDPDALLITETKLDDNISNREILPKGYNCYRKDQSWNGGGVLVAVKSCYHTQHIVPQDINAEVVWMKVNLRSNRLLYIGSFYRQPNIHSDQVDGLDNHWNKLHR